MKEFEFCQDCGSIRLPTHCTVCQQNEKLNIAIKALESIELIPLGGLNFTSTKKYLEYSHKLSQLKSKEALEKIRI